MLQGEDLSELTQSQRLFVRSIQDPAERSRVVATMSTENADIVQRVVEDDRTSGTGTGPSRGPSGGPDDAIRQTYQEYNQGGPHTDVGRRRYKQHLLDERSARNASSSAGSSRK